MESKLFPPTLLCLGIQATRPFLLCFWCCTSSSNANNYKCEMLSESRCFFSSQSLPILIFFPSFSCSANSFQTGWWRQVVRAGCTYAPLFPHLLLLRQCLYFAPLLVWQSWHNRSWSLVRVCSEAHNIFSDVLYECLVTQIWDGAAVLGPKQIVSSL